MSDGPHRSLPLRPHWRTLARRAAKAAHSPDEVAEALPFALKRELLQAPLKKIREILCGDTLFPSIRIEQLESIRGKHTGSAPAQLAIDCAIAAVANGATGEAGAQAAVSAALADTMHSALRATEEHYQREASPRSSSYVRQRLDAARQKVDCSALARELLSGNAPPKREAINLPTRKGVDEGPPL
ncbi:hypothetical protein [Methylocella sp.]|uniref:hypothetical protein n=1 Tax=Methylocella sp. TaxID=1978226 RepID=UPI0035B20380